MRRLLRQFRMGEEAENAEAVIDRQRDDALARHRSRRRSAAQNRRLRRIRRRKNRRAPAVRPGRRLRRRPDVQVEAVLAHPVRPEVHVAEDRRLHAARAELGRLANTLPVLDRLRRLPAQLAGGRCAERNSAIHVDPAGFRHAFYRAIGRLDDIGGQHTGDGNSDHDNQSRNQVLQHAASLTQTGIRDSGLGIRDWGLRDSGIRDCAWGFAFRRSYPFRRKMTIGRAGELIAISCAVASLRDRASAGAGRDEWRPRRGCSRVPAPAETERSSSPPRLMSPRPTKSRGKQQPLAKDPLAGRPRTSASAMLPRRTTSQSPRSAAIARRAALERPPVFRIGRVDVHGRKRLQRIHA